MKSPELENRILEAKKLILKDSIYFAHPITLYNTEKELKLIDAIKKKFTGVNVYNPGERKSDGDNYQFWKKTFGSGMKYYTEVILPNMIGGIALPFEDGMFGAGVCTEMDFLKKIEKPLWTIDYSFNILPCFEILNEKRLSVEDTIKRVRP